MLKLRAVDRLLDWTDEEENTALAERFAILAWAVHLEQS